MAESYRGLTIRIGGDTTSLNKALHTTNQAAAGTQSALRKLNSALKLDPTSVSAANMQVGAMAEQASNTANRMLMLNSAMHQIGGEFKTFNGASATVKEMADSWRNVSMTASQARDQYSAMTRTLAETYTAFSKVYSESSKMASVKMADNLTMKYDNLDEMASQVREVAHAFNANDEQVERFINRLSSISSRYDELLDEQEKLQAAIDSGDLDGKDFQKMADRLGKVNEMIGTTENRLVKLKEGFKGFKSEELFAYDKDNTNLASLATALKKIVDAGGMTVEQADKMYDSFERMKDKWEDTFENVQTANAVEGFRDLEAESAKSEANVRKLVDGLFKLAQTSSVSKGLVELRDRLKEITERGKEAQARLSETLTAISKGMRANGNDDSTKSLWADAVRAYSDEVAEARAAVANLQEQISHFTDEKVVELAASARSLSEATQSESERWDEAHTALVTYEGALDKVKQQIYDIENSNPSGYEDDENYKELQLQAKAFDEVLKITRQHAEETATSFDKMAQAGELREKLQQLHLAEDTLKRLSEINVKPEIDVSAVEGMKKSLDAIGKGFFGNTAFSKFTEDIKTANTALEQAEQKYKALSDAWNKNPTNSDTATMRGEALNQLVDKLNAKIAVLKEAISSIPSDKINKVAISTGQVSEEFSKAQKRVDDVSKAIASTEEQIKILTNKRGEIKIVDGKSALEVYNLTRRIQELKQKLAELETEADDALDDLVTAENTRLVEEYNTEIQQLIARLHELGIEVEKSQLMGGNGKDLTPKVDDAAFMQAVDRVSQAARRMASEVVQSANEIDSAYRDMRKTVNGTEEEYEALKDSAIEFSQTHVTSTDTMLEMQALGGQLGILTEDLRQFGEIGSNLDIATDMNAEDIALKLGQISNVLHLDIDGIQGFADALVRLGNNMPAQESAIMAVAQRFGAVASTASFSGDEILAWSAAIASTGQRSEAAATAIGNTVSGIEQAIANGGNDLKQFAAIAGMSADEFVSTWKSSPTEALKSFINGLQTLVDSDESAVAALENMGITGVRQQQTLLGLSQTIDSLDKALEISGNAWNQISDDWGDAGDAANEAEKKAAGFSGALAILKNNAQNLAAVFGDSLVGPMKIAAEAIKLITDALTAMPPYVRNIVVGLSAANIAFSTVAPVLRIFNNGIADLLLKLSQSTTISQFAAKLLGLESAIQTVRTANGGLLTSFSSLAGKTVVFAALATAIHVAFAAMEEYERKQELLRMSTEGMVEAINSAQAAYDGYAPSIHDAMSSLEELRAKNEEITQSQAALAEEMGKKWEEFGVKAAMVDSYAESIYRLSDAGELTASQQAELVASVKAFNEITGSNIEILDQQNGILDKSDSYIMNLAESWKSLAESEAAYEMYKDVVKQRIEDEIALTEATHSLEEAQSAAQTVQGGWFNDMRDGASASNAAADGVAAYKKEVDEAQKKVDSAKETEEQFLKIMNDSYSVFGQMRTALVEAGEGTEEFDKLTKEQLAQVAAEYDGTAASVIAAIKRIKDATDEAGSILGELESSSDKAVKSAYNTAKAQFDAAYKTLKSDLDQKYKEAQRAFNNEYKLQQRAYDAIYKAQQKAYDSEYKAAQKAYDAEYKQQQKEYDKQYKALQKKLDAEYKARKSTYDKELKALKDANDDEVEAFKKATDAKLKEMEREYKAKLKLLELEYGQKDSDIDDQIEALESETKAEKQAIEERKQQEKIAELEREVTRANSRRKRAEAEKALNDYIQQVEQERNEESRKAEIERLKEQQSALKDELAERKEALKESYEAEVEAYKEKRENELDALKEANDLEYEARKEYYDTQLELLKENQTAQLEATKENQQAALEAMKENQQAQLESLKESQTEQLEALKQSQQDALDSLKTSQQEQLDNMKAAHQKQLDDLKATQKKKLQEIKDGNAAIDEEQKKATEASAENAKNAGEEYNRNIAPGYNKAIGTTKWTNTEMQKSYNTMERDAGLAGAGVGGGLFNAMDPGMRDVMDLGTRAHNSISDSLSVLGVNATTWGDHLGYNFFDSFDRWRASIVGVASSISVGIAGFLQHSTPKRGPLRNDDVWGEHLVQNIVDGMRSKEGELYRQVENMARAVEDGFDPTLTVDAAYEALDAISKNGRSLTIEAAKASAPVITIDMTLNVSDFSIRNDSDIDRLSDQISQKMAAAAARELAGRLG